LIARKITLEKDLDAFQDSLKTVKLLTEKYSVNQLEGAAAWPFVLSTMVKNSSGG
jgi:hypothetical protein